jgi:hypothetical protein
MPYKKLRQIGKFSFLFQFIIAFIAILGVINAFAQSSKMIQGKDYVVLKRLRVLDEMGFDKPVEAMSVLVPSGWKAQGGVKWNSIGGCRGEIVVWQISVASPDGQIEYMAFPVRTFVYSQDQMMQQVYLTAARQGGCQVSAPFNAAQYLQLLARDGLKATVSSIRQDESLQAMLNKMNADSNEISRQYGTNMSTSSSMIYGTLNWSDGKKGLAQIGVMMTASPSRNMYTGAPDGFASTTVFHQVVVRYPPEREAEALRLFATINTSYRMNPIWKNAKDNFLTQLGNAEHAGRMERLRLMGEQSRAYAKAQSEASDARMRDWERNQSSSDASQRRFIQTIREVETWKDGDGNSVELGSGYKYGWSKPDGSYILTNNSLFNPAVELQQNWVKMQKAPQ